MPYIPAALLALFAAWSGSFPGGATFTGALSGQLAVLGAAVIAAGAWRDPLRLGTAGRFIPLALWIALLASWWASPVPRAGLVGVILLPAFLLVPAAVERCWAGEAARRMGLRAVALVHAAISVWSLTDRFVLGSPRAAMPLGHHNLLAGWVIAVLPLALVPLREGGAWRWVAGVSGLAGVAAVLASGSLLGAVALGVQILLGLLWMRRWHRLLLPAALLALALQMPRAAAIFSGEDPSAQARLVYVQAGWNGLRARPLLGWGPGSVPWTIAEFLRPVPGVNPPSEVVGDLHSLPLQILYELGVTGFLFALGTAALFLRRRLRERDHGEDPTLLAAGLVGLLGAAVTRLGGASLSVTALPLAVGVAAGAALAARPRAGDWRGSAAPLAYATVVLALLARPDLAQLHYDRAVTAPTADRALREVESARRLDPSFSLYEARHAWLAARASSAPAAAGEALEAAEGAGAVAPLWLQAGVLAPPRAEVSARRALERVCALDPLGALAPFFLTMLAPSDPSAAERAARAFVAEPRLLAATYWQGRDALRQSAVQQVAVRVELDPAWRQAFVEQAAATRSPTGPTALLGLEMDAEPPLSFSLHAFRRSPWPEVLAPVEVRRDAARGITLPALTRLPNTPRDAFPPGCTPR